VTTRNDLQRVVEEMAALRDEVRQLREALASPPASYLTAGELAQMLQVSYETVRRRVAAGEWPALMIGRQARFGPEEQAAIRQASLKRAPEPPMTSSERRQRNKRLRALRLGGGM